MENDNGAEAAGTFATLIDGVLWFFQNLGLAFYNIAYAITHPSAWLDWVTWANTPEDKLSLMKFVYYGGSTQFFFAVLAVILVVTAVGLWKREFMWGCVRVMEGIANTSGRLFAWAGLLMVLQQIIIVFMQRIFTRPDISIGFGIPLQFDISWFAEELKLYNALVVCMCVTYTFVQGGHVRVDLFYSAVKFRTKRVIDMFGSLVFMLPSATLIWMYGWYFLWRHLVTPKPAASWDIERAERSARAVRWNVETIGFSPNGFNGYFLFKILLVAFAGLVFLHAIAFFYRSYLEWKEGEESEGKYLDRDTLGEGEEAYEGTH
ncbi:TRAP transporter small permease subunit [uncultured Tateyamaria sp.]|uniref:TRAP transporter small permease subunit n=1 Tax=uncultured Tateyamaria sp. TaxID=455651 RepID=UPI002608AAA0|nr:TRAP transporter small permease subunit [uncultured Tateyamaria sp.]